MAAKAANLGSLVWIVRDAIASTPSGAAALAWPEIAGERIAEHAWVDGVTGDTLEIAVDSPAWAHSLQLMSPELLARLRERAHLEESVSRIRFRPIRSKDKGPPATVPQGPARDPEPTTARGDAGAAFSQEALAELDEAVGKAGDAQIVEALRHLLRAFAGGRMAGTARR